METTSLGGDETTRGHEIGSPGYVYVRDDREETGLRGRIGEETHESFDKLRNPR